MDGTGAAIECQGLTRRFGARAAVADLTMSVPRGAVFGFLGPNGAGKTTTARMLVGMIRPTAGTVRILDHDPIVDGEWVRSRCGVLVDSVGLYERLSARANLEFAARIARLSGREGRERVDAALHRVHLWDRQHDRVSGFSKGMRQQLGLARALIGDPEVLILDEPTSGLDPANIVLVRELLMSLAQESGRTIFLCTHHLDEAQRMCDRVAVIQAGRLVAQGDPSHLGSTERPTYRLTLSGGEAGQISLGRLPAGAEWSRLGGAEWRLVVGEPADIEPVVVALVGAGIGVRAVIPERESLEEEYLRLVGGDQHE